MHRCRGHQPLAVGVDRAGQVARLAQRAAARTTSSRPGRRWPPRWRATSPPSRRPPRRTPRPRWRPSTGRITSVPSWRREIARADTKPLSDRVRARRRVHQVAATPSAGSPPARPRPRAAPAARMSVRSGSLWPDAESLRDEWRGRAPPGSAGPRPTTVATPAVGVRPRAGRRGCRARPSRPRRRPRRSPRQHERGGRPAQPRQRQRQPGHQPLSDQHRAQADAEADAERDGHQQDRERLGQARAARAGATRRRAARRARAPAPGSRWPPSAAASAAPGRPAPATAPPARSTCGPWTAGRGRRRRRRARLLVSGIADQRAAVDLVGRCRACRRWRTASARSRGGRVGGHVERGVDLHAPSPAPSDRSSRGGDQRRRLVGLVAAVDAGLLVARARRSGKCQTSSDIGVAVGADDGDLVEREPRAGRGR